MFNPFRKRASEYLRDDEAFLATVSPVPLHTYVVPQADALYDRLVVVTGTPGSGKTTISKLMRYNALLTLQRLADAPEHRPLLDTMAELGAVVGGRVAVAGCRLPMEGRYREIWELPYEAGVKHRLLTALIQARAVLEWLSGFEAAGIEVSAVSVTPKVKSPAMIEAIGGTGGIGLRARAEAVETVIYGITKALVPPRIDALSWAELAGAYEPFDVIDTFEITGRGGIVHSVKPLLVLDDAHDLHVRQFEALNVWLRQRELGPARWVVARFDAFDTADVVSTRAPDGQEGPGVDRAREVTFIRLQGDHEDRRRERVEFRRLARDMSRRYLSQMDVFRRRGLTDLNSLLDARLDEFPSSRLAELSQKVRRAQAELDVHANRLAALRAAVDEFARNRSETEITEAIKLQMTHILLHRYANRVQRSLFEDDDPDPNRELAVEPSLARGALIQLMHDVDGPYYFGFDDLADASWENAQQFLKLGASIVDVIETRLIRDRRALLLTPAEQTRLLRDVGRQIVAEWSFPRSEAVRRLTDWMGRECLQRTLEPSAPLGAGANAVAIPQEQFDALLGERGDLASILKYAVAYNAITIVTNRNVKNRVWAILELGGPLVLMHGLPLDRGGFVPRDIRNIRSAVGEPA